MRRIPLPGIYLLVLAISAATVGAFIAAGINRANASSSSNIQNGPTITADVQRVLETQGTGYQLLITYEVEGRTYSKSMSYQTTATTPPKSVSVSYRLGDPGEAEVTGQPRFSATRADGFIASGILFGILDAFLIFVISRRRRRWRHSAAPS